MELEYRLMEENETKKELIVALQLMVKLYKARIANAPPEELRYLFRDAQNTLDRLANEIGGINLPSPHDW